MDVQVTKLGVLPIAQQFIEELGICELIDKHTERGKEEISHGQVVNVLLLNLLDSNKPLYKVSDWLCDYTDGLGEFSSESNKYNDKRLGATLDKLYSSSRDTLLTELSGKAIEIHKIATEIFHNDSTTVTFKGAYTNSKAADSDIEIKHGYNKDYRPDCKQIVFGLTVSGDGYVPLLSKFYSGNTSDDSTHIPNWDALRDLVNKVDFIYIADSKLSTMENLVHISSNGGFFISILPKSRKETRSILETLSALPKASDLLACSWEEAYRVANPREKGKATVYRIKEGEKTKEGFRLIWIYSSSKAEQDAARRTKKLAKGAKILEELGGKLNKYNLKTEEQIQTAIDNKLSKTRDFFKITLNKKEEIIKVKIGRGRPNTNSKYEEKTVISYELQYALDEEQVQKASNRDGVFPLVTNTEKQAVEVLKAYKNQPFLEKRFMALKSILEVAPVFIEKPERIEAMLFLYVIALMLISLIERKIHNNMKDKEIKTLAILPQGMKTKKPTWANIKFCFNSVIMVSMVSKDTKNFKSQVKGLNKQQLKVLELLDIQTHKFDNMTPSWWKKRSFAGSN